MMENRMFKADTNPQTDKFIHKDRDFVVENNHTGTKHGQFYLIEEKAVDQMNMQTQSSIFICILQTTAKPKASTKFYTESNTQKRETESNGNKISQL